jgi:hypothetical protein
VPRLSILIPCLGDCREFENTLASVLQNRPDDCEILVAHVQDYHDPYHLRGEVCFLPVPEARSLVALLNAGFEAARSGIIHVLQCGMEVEEHWTEQAVEQLGDPQVASVAPLLVDVQTGSRLISAGLSYSRWGRRQAVAAGKSLASYRPNADELLGPTLAAGFYRRSWWRIARWDDTFGDAFADVHYGLTLRALGGQTLLATDCVIRSEKDRGWAADEPFDFATARSAERLFACHAQQPITTATRAFRALLMGVEAVAALPSPRAVTGLLGRVAGLLGHSPAADFAVRLAELRAKLAAEQAAETEATIPFPVVHERRSSPGMPQRRAA